VQSFIYFDLIANEKALCVMFHNKHPVFFDGMFMDCKSPAGKYVLIADRAYMNHWRKNINSNYPFALICADSIS